MSSEPVLLFSRSDVADLLDPAATVEAVEAAFRAQGEGTAGPAGVLGTHVEGGRFHVKAAALTRGGGRAFYAAKVNGNFPGNPDRGLPTIQGVLVLADASNGTPLAVMESGELTARRTAAASAVAARHLACADADTAAIIRCGAQARAHLAALLVVRALKAVWVADQDTERARAFATQAAREFGIEVRAAESVRRAARAAPIVVTCTTALAPILHPGDVLPGTFVAAVGADSERKSEIAPALMAGAAVVCDVVEQCARIGDLHHALEAGAMRLEDVRGELGRVVAGRGAGRRSDDEIVIFDSTGTALLDVAAAAVVYERARAAGGGRGTPVPLRD